ncbi:hypothetical protein GQ600_24301 [Phytophthora cactorum]|nr:hypothetical protein GQ600_24301 [Phytophthora cactorum]
MEDVVDALQRHLGIIANRDSAQTSGSHGSKGDFDIKTYADVMVWSTPVLYTSPSTRLGRTRYKAQHDSQRITDTVGSRDISVGIIFTSRRLFRTASRTAVAQMGEVLGATDGAYKLHFGGWALVSFGTFGVRFTSSLKYQHKFYPMTLVIVRAEAFGYSFRETFSICKAWCQEVLGYH